MRIGDYAPDLYIEDAFCNRVDEAYVLEQISKSYCMLWIMKHGLPVIVLQKTSEGIMLYSDKTVSCIASRTLNLQRIIDVANEVLASEKVS